MFRINENNFSLNEENFFLNENNFRLNDNNFKDINVAKIFHTSISATWMAVLKGPTGKYATLDWGDGSVPTTLELSPTGVDFIHDYSGAGAGIKIINIYGDLDIIAYLNSYTSNITKIKNFSPFVDMDELILTDNNISNISDLATLISLSDLNLGYNNITDISPLSNLTNMLVLHLRNNSISDVSSLINLANLTNLYLHNNIINDVSPLSSMTNLVSLRLRNNSFSDISPLVALVNLTDLWLDNNNINYPLTGLSWFTATSGLFYFNSTVDSSAEVDRWLIDLATADWSNCTIYLDGTNPARTSASDAAVAILIANGCILHLS